MIRTFKFVTKAWRAIIVTAVVMLFSSVSLADEGSYILTVAGLACPFCTYGVEKELGAIEGVDSIETSIDTGTVIVTMREGASLDEVTADEAIEAAGFSLSNFEPATAIQ